MEYLAREGINLHFYRIPGVINWNISSLASLGGVKESHGSSVTEPFPY